MDRRSKSLRILFASLVLCATPALGEPVVRYTGDGSDLQPLLDNLPEHAVVVCDESKTFTFRKPLMIRRALTLQGLHARLPEKLGRTALIEVHAEGVKLLDLELHGNYDSVPQDQRHTLIWIARGGFRIERCRFFDGSKDGVMITPEPEHGDLVGGTVRGITAKRMGRDAVSISGGNRGARVINVSVEDVRLEQGFLRGAVEVSDGTKDITVKNVHASNCVYAVDVQDHKGASAPNVNVHLEDITAVDCKHIVRTANSPRGHADLTLRKVVGVRCQYPLVISHTRNVVLDGIRIEQHAADAAVPVHLRLCQGVSIKDLEVVDSDYAGDPLRLDKCEDVTLVEFIVGDYLESEGGDWNSEQSPLRGPFGIDFDSSGSMYIVELSSGRLHQRSPSGQLRTLRDVHPKGYAGDGGPVSDADFNGPHNCVVTADDQLLIADSWNHCVRRVDLETLQVATIAGTGAEGFSDDQGAARSATFNFVMCIALDPGRRTLHIADLKNLRIRNMDLKSGRIETVAGNGQKGVPTDGSLAKDSSLVDPRAVASDARGNLYILERNGNALRVVRPDGTIHTVAGNGERGFRDGAALQAQFGSPKHISCDPQGNVYIADDVNGAIRKYDPGTGQVSTVLGRGFGDPKITLEHPHGVCWHAGWLYVVDTGHSRILRLACQPANFSFR